SPASAPLPDVGGWFATAIGDARPGLRVRPWEPLGGFGRTSPDEDVVAAADCIRHRTTMVLTGAGMSTGSGLPDYRGREAVVRNPMTYQEFVGSDLARRRYWARSTVGWVAFGAARPNPAHHRLVDLTVRVPVTGIVTQNV